MTKVEGAHTTAQDMKMVKLFPLLSTINRSWGIKTGNITFGHNSKFQNHFSAWNKILVL